MRRTDFLRKRTYFPRACFPHGCFPPACFLPTCFQGLLAAAILALALSACKQPFEPDGPTGNKLIVYSILNKQTDTQYVRLATTYRSGPGPIVQGASVSVSIVGTPSLPPNVDRTVVFRDTAIDHLNAQGVVEHLPIYVSYHFRPLDGVTYQLSAQMAGTAAPAQATTTTLGSPDFNLQNSDALRPDGNRQILVDAWFPSASGAYELHFFVEFYALVNGGWELHREEVPGRSYTDDAGNEVRVYPSLAPISSLAGSTGSTVLIALDTVQYRAVRRRVFSRYGAPQVVLLQALFVLTQIDDVLYNYYYLNNGVLDQSSVRLDVPEYTNIGGGLGVFGNGVVIRKTYSLMDL